MGKGEMGMGEGMGEGNGEGMGERGRRRAGRRRAHAHHHGHHHHHHHHHHPLHHRRIRFGFRARRRRPHTGEAGGGGGNVMRINLFCCCKKPEIESVEEHDEIRQSVVDIIQQQTYLLQERRIVQISMQSFNPTERKVGETTRKTEQERFVAIAANQKATYEEILQKEHIVTDPEIIRMLTEDKNALLSHIQQLVSLGYEYPKSIPGVIDVPERKALGGICVICNKDLMNFQYRCHLCPWLSLCSECHSRGIHNDHRDNLTKTGQTCLELAKI